MNINPNSQNINQHFHTIAEHYCCEKIQELKAQAALLKDFFLNNLRNTPTWEAHISREVEKKIKRVCFKKIARSAIKEVSALLQIHFSKEDSKELDFYVKNPHYFQVHPKMDRLTPKISRITREYFVNELGLNGLTLFLKKDPQLKNRIEQILVNNPTPL